MGKIWSLSSFITKSIQDTVMLLSDEDTSQAVKGGEEGGRPWQSKLELCLWLGSVFMFYDNDSNSLHVPDMAHPYL